MYTTYDSTTWTDYYFHYHRYYTVNSLSAKEENNARWEERQYRGTLHFQLGKFSLGKDLGDDPNSSSSQRKVPGRDNMPGPFTE